MKLFSSRLEKQAIKVICANTSASSKLLAACTKEHFHTTAARRAYERIQVLAKTHNEIPTYRELCEDPALEDSIRTELRSFSASIKQNKKSASILTDKLNRYRVTRLVYSAMEENMEDLKKPKVDTDVLLQRFSKTIDKAITNKSLPMLSFGGKSDRILEKTKDFLKGKSPVSVIPTGFAAFDNVNRGFFKGSLVILASTSGGGKSTLALQMAQNMGRYGAKVALYSLEMTEDELLLREMARKGRVPMVDIINERLTPKQKRQIREAMEKEHRAYQKKDSKTTIIAPDSAVTIQEALYSLKPYGYDVIIVDYMTLLKDSGGENQWQKLSEIAWFAKLHAKSTNSIVVLLAQFDSRENQIRYSRGVQEHANNMWIWNRDQKSKESKLLYIEQPKARNHVGHSFELYENFEMMEVTDVPKDYVRPLSGNDNNSKQDRKDKVHVMT